jgi:hypothetical protein
MPEISRFFGIRNAMFFNEHNPLHFHVMYEGQKAVVNIRTLASAKGHYRPGLAAWLSSGPLCINTN